MPKMELSTLKAMLASERQDALASMSSAKLAIERSDAMDYYLGKMSKDMPTQEGRSKAVSSDVADTVEGLMPALMDIFCSSDEVVKFEAVGAEDEQAAQQETDYVNHVFMQQNPGFMVMYSFIKDALLQKVGIVKVWWDEREEEERETYLDLQDDQFALLAQDVLQPESGLEIIEHTEEQQPGAPDPVTGQPTVIKTHNVTVLRTKEYKQAKVEGVPPEEFGIERNARTIKDCNYCFHEPPRTQGQLIAQGFDKKQIEALPTRSLVETTEQQSRDSVDEEYWAGESIDRASRPIQTTEHYKRMDYEGQGRICLYKITTGGHQGDILLKKDGKLDIEEFDIIPFAAVTPVPITHRFFGRSLADLVMDIQRINTALLRGLLDNSYMVARPRTEIAESHANQNTLDDLLTVRDNGIVRTKMPGGLQQLQTPSIVGEILPVMTYMDGVREMRTGVTRQGQGVDADALQNQSATAVKQVFSATQARMKLIARIIAETGVRDMFSLLHATIRKHGQEAATVKLRNQWVSVDPRNWKTRSDMTVNVGLGTGGKAEQFAQRMAIAGVQEKLVAAGKSNIVDDAKLFATASSLSKLIGDKNPDMYFNDPASKNPDGTPKYPAPPPPVDPRVMAVQAKMQGDQQALQSKTQLETVQAQADIAVQERKTQAEMAQTERDYQLKERLALLEAQLKEREDQRKHEAHLQDMQHKRELHDHALKQGALGMVATAQSHDAKIEQMKAKPEPANA